MLEQAVELGSEIAGFLAQSRLLAPSRDGRQSREHGAALSTKVSTASLTRQVHRRYTLPARLLHRNASQRALLTINRYEAEIQTIPKERRGLLFRRQRHKKQISLKTTDRDEALRLPSAIIEARLPRADLMGILTDQLHFCCLLLLLFLAPATLHGRGIVTKALKAACLCSTPLAFGPCS